MGRTYSVCAGKPLIITPNASIIMLPTHQALLQLLSVDWFMQSHTYVQTHTGIGAGHVCLSFPNEESEEAW